MFSIIKHKANLKDATMFNSKSAVGNHKKPLKCLLRLTFESIFLLLLQPEIKKVGPFYELFH